MIAIAILKNKIFKLFIYRCLLPQVIANAKDWIGVKIGDTSIDQIITGIELDNNHNVANIHEITNCTQYKISTFALAIISLAICCFFSGERRNEKILFTFS